MYKGDGVAKELMIEIQRQKDNLNDWMDSFRNVLGASGVVGVLNVGIQQEYPHNVGRSWSCRFTTPWDGTFTKSQVVDPNSLEHCVLRYLCEVSDKHHYLYDDGVCPPRGERTGHTFVNWKRSSKATSLEVKYSNGAYRNPSSSTKRNLNANVRSLIATMFGYGARAGGSLCHGSSWQICEIATGVRNTVCVGRMDVEQ